MTFVRFGWILSESSCILEKVEPRKGMERPMAAMIRAYSRVGQHFESRARREQALATLGAVCEVVGGVVLGLLMLPVVCYAILRGR
jgi:hypothetical protein